MRRCSSIAPRPSPGAAAARPFPHWHRSSVPPDAPAAYVNFSRALPGKVVDASHDNILFAPGAVIAKHVLVLLFNPYPDPHRAESTQVAIAGRVSRARKARIATLTFNVSRPAASPDAAPPAVAEDVDGGAGEEDEWGEMADLVRSVVRDSVGEGDRAAGAVVDPYGEPPPDTASVAAQMQDSDAAVPPVDLRWGIGRNASTPARRTPDAPEQGEALGGGSLDPGLEASIADGAVRAARSQEPWRRGVDGRGPEKPDDGGEGRELEIPDESESEPAPPPPPDLLPRGGPPPGMPPAHAFAPTVRHRVAARAQDAAPPDEKPPWLEALEDDADPSVQELSKHLDDPPPRQGGRGQRGSKNAARPKQAHAAPKGKRRRSRAAASRRRRGADASGPSRRLLAEPLSLAQHGPAALAVSAAAAVGRPREGSPASRRLLDEFAESLRFVDSLMNAAYGPSDGRQVMAHMPHLVDRDVVQSMQAKCVAATSGLAGHGEGGRRAMASPAYRHPSPLDLPPHRRWPSEFTETGRRRFRSGRDMQFAFTYFYYLMSEPATFDAARFWRERLDLDGDECALRQSLRPPLPRSRTRAALPHTVPRSALDENEIRTLAQYLGLEADAVGVARLHYLLIEDPPCAWELNITKLEAVVHTGQADVFMVRPPNAPGMGLGARGRDAL